jgi:hypothetical protein
MHFKNSNVVDIQTGELLNQDTGARPNHDVHTEKYTAPPEENVCEAVKQYRIQRDAEAQQRDAGWPEAVGLGLLLNLLGVF